MKIEYTMSSRGKLFLIYDHHQFVKRNTFKNRIYWACTQRSSLKCEARVIQDVETNRLEIPKLCVHNHEALKGRRKAGNLQFDLFSYFLAATFCVFR